MRLELNTALELVGLLHDAAIDPRRWRLAVSRLMEIFDGAVGAYVQALPGPYPLILKELHVGIEPTPEQLQLYKALQKDDPRSMWAMQNIGRAGASNLVLDPAVMKGSRIYRELLHGADIEYTLMLPDFVDQQVMAAISVTRRRADPPFTQDDVDALQRLQPHFARALRTQIRLGASDRLLADLRDALNRLPVGVVLLGVDGRVRFVTEIAERILEKQDGLHLNGKSLHAHQPPSEALLQPILRQAIDAAADRQLLRQDTLKIGRPSGHRSYELLVSPLRADRLGIWPDHPVAMVIIHDPSGVPALPWQLVQRLYGLSPAEARLSVAVAHGTALKEYSKENSISIETARSQLKSAMSKTGTHRQVELSRLLLTGPAAYALLSEQPAPPP